MKKVMALLFVLGSVSISAQVQTNEVNSTGKIGINTTSPSTELEVKGKTKLDGETEVVGYTIMKDCVKVEKKLSIDQDIKVQGESVLVGNAKAKADMKVMGTTKMKGNAFVEGNFKFKGLADSAATDDRFLMINPNGKAKSLDKASFVYEVSDAFLEFDCTPKPGFPFPIPSWAATSNNDHGILYTGYNCPSWVGIGTNDPQSEIDVKGNGIFSGDVGIGDNYNFNTKLLVKQKNPIRDGINVELTNTNSSGVGVKIVMHNLENKAFTITNGVSGEDTYRVMSDGAVWATSVRVRDVGDFPDYVFDESYELMDLDSLEKYIQKERHLPGMPTANSIASEGMDLGEINRLLVEKLEELTLVLIDLNKKIAKQEEEITYLKNQ